MCFLPLVFLAGGGWGLSGWGWLGARWLGIAGGQVVYCIFRFLCFSLVEIFGFVAFLFLCICSCFCVVLFYFLCCLVLLCAHACAPANNIKSCDFAFVFCFCLLLFVSPCAFLCTGICTSTHLHFAQFTKNRIIIFYDFLLKNNKKCKNSLRFSVMAFFAY